MKSRDFKNCQTTVSVACLANDLVFPKFVQGARTVNIQENSSSYVVIIEAPYLLGSQPSALIISSL